MKKKIFNSILSFFLALTMIAGFCSNVSAASFSLRATSSIAPNEKFNVTVSGLSSLRGRFTVSITNGSGITSFMANGQASQPISVTAGSSGSVNVVVTAADVYTLDEDPITGSEDISVSIKKPSTPSGGNNGSSSAGNSGNSGNSNNTGNNGGATTPDNRSKDNSLESLTVSNGTLSPKFSANETSYKVDLTSDITKLTINAKAKDSKAKVSGDGEKELKIGENNFIISVVAENGAKKTYTISAYVTEKATVFTKFSDKDYGVLTDFSKADLPKGFSPTNVKVGDKDVAALKNETLGLTLLYLQDSEGNTGFYIYENGAVIGKFQTVSINQKVYVMLSDTNVVKEISGVKQGTIKIGDLEVQGWTFDDKKLSNYSLVYLMNDVGEKVLYSYEATEGTLQKYVSNTTSSNSTLTYVFIGTTALFAITTAVAVGFYFNFKKKSISAIKDYYDSKNQGE